MKTSRITALILATATGLGCRLGGATPLGRAAAAGDLSAMTALLARGADPNLSGGFGITPLASAARAGRVDAIELLLSKGADPHRGCGVNGWTPLQHALHKNQRKAAMRLMDTVQAPSPELDDALYMAAGYAQADMVAALLVHGADPRKDFGEGANALSNAVSGAFDIDFHYPGCAEPTDTVRALLSVPDLALTGKAGRSARRAAERRGCNDMLTLLK